MLTTCVLHQSINLIQCTSSIIGFSQLPGQHSFIHSYRTCAQLPKSPTARCTTTPKISPERCSPQTSTRKWEETEVKGEEEEFMVCSVRMYAYVYCGIFTQIVTLALFNVIKKSNFACFHHPKSKVIMSTLKGENLQIVSQFSVAVCFVFLCLLTTQPQVNAAKAIKYLALPYHCFPDDNIDYLPCMISFIHGTCIYAPRLGFSLPTLSWFNFHGMDGPISLFVRHKQDLSKAITERLSRHMLAYSLAFVRLFRRMREKRDTSPI